MSLSFQLHSDKVFYFHAESNLPLNSFVGKKVRIALSPLKFCLGCNKKTTADSGYCYLCFKTLARCDLCFLAPYRCHYENHTCREPQWGLETCWKDHIVYLAFSPHPKIGLTQLKNIPKRWLEQGADFAFPLIQVPSRKAAGILEKALFEEGWGGQTKWRDFIKGAEPLAAQERQEMAQKAQSRLEEIALDKNISILLLTLEERAFHYPLLQHPKDKFTLGGKDLEIHEGICLGWKGSYLFFEEGYVVNLKKYLGQKWTIEVLDK